MRVILFMGDEVCLLGVCLGGGRVLPLGSLQPWGGWADSRPGNQFDTMGYSQQVGGTHHTEMLSCFDFNHWQTKFAKVMFSQVSVCPQGGKDPSRQTPP